MPPKKRRVASGPPPPADMPANAAASAEHPADTDPSSIDAPAAPTASTSSAAEAKAERGVLLEVCCDSVASCLAAEAGGASRIELCSGLVEGGLTPSIGLVATAVAATSLPVMVLIRPRPGDFVHTAVEVDAMVRDVEAIGTVGAAGVVIGALDAEGAPDMPTLTRMVGAAKAAGLGCTFHRAIDMARDPVEVLQACVSLGIDRILTSGGSNTALAGASTIANLVTQSAGTAVSIMAGGGVTEDNAKELADRTGVTEIHGSFRVPQPCATRYRKKGVFMGGSKENTQESEFMIKVAGADRVAEAVTALADLEVKHFPVLARQDRLQ